MWLTGLPCSGKTTIATRLASLLALRGERVEVLDADLVRPQLSCELGFSRDDRDANVRRMGFVAHLLSRNGVVVLVAAVSPYRAARQLVREQVGDFVEVFVDCPLVECERRDVKGMYAEARAGLRRSFTGVDDPYEPPERPDVVLCTGNRGAEACTWDLLLALEGLGYTM